MGAPLSSLDIGCCIAPDPAIGDLGGRRIRVLLSRDPMLCGDERELEPTLDLSLLCLYHRGAQCSVEPFDLYSLLLAFPGLGYAVEAFPWPCRLFGGGQKNAADRSRGFSRYSLYCVAHPSGVAKTVAGHGFKLVGVHKPCPPNGRLPVGAVVDQVETARGEISFCPRLGPTSVQLV